MVEILNIAPIVAASFFVIAIVEWFNLLQKVNRSDKKDIADSGWNGEKK